MTLLLERRTSLVSNIHPFMANVLHPHIDFGPRPAAHASSPLGFGFGLGTPASSAMVAAWQLSPTPGYTNPSASHQPTSVNQNAPSRPLKRRHEPQDDAETSRARDHSMDRSPTPERPKRVAPKRARLAPVLGYSTRNEAVAKENKEQSANIDDDIDAGVLLGPCLPIVCIFFFHGWNLFFSKSTI